MPTGWCCYTPTACWNPVFNLPISTGKSVTLCVIEATWLYDASMYSDHRKVQLDHQIIRLKRKMLRLQTELATCEWRWLSRWQTPVIKKRHYGQMRGKTTKWKLAFAKFDCMEGEAVLPLQRFPQEPFFSREVARFSSGGNDFPLLWNCVFLRNITLRYANKQTDVPDTMNI